MSTVYVASRTGHAARWRELRGQGWPINSTWIDEAGPGETADLSELWVRVVREVSEATGVVLYAEAGDFPLKGALIEVGAALAIEKPVAVVLVGVELEPRSLRPVGSWLTHPKVALCVGLEAAFRSVLAQACTGPSASWCPNCGTCTCGPAHDSCPGGDECRCSPACPLHGNGSRHE